MCTAISSSAWCHAPESTPHEPTMGSVKNGNLHSVHPGCCSLRCFLPATNPGRTWTDRPWQFLLGRRTCLDPSILNCPERHSRLPTQHSPVGVTSFMVRPIREFSTGATHGKSMRPFTNKPPAHTHQGRIAIICQTMKVALDHERQLLATVSSLRIRTMSGSPLARASFAGVSPLRFCALTSAPASTSSFAAAGRTHAAA